MDPLIKSQLLYQLSYAPIESIGPVPTLVQIANPPVPVQRRGRARRRGCGGRHRASMSGLILPRFTISLFKAAM